jgi:hypothetical protein
MDFSFIFGDKTMNIKLIIQLIATFVIFQLALIGTECSANEYSIGYAPICRHVNNSKLDLNEVNHGVFVGYNKWIAGTFNNSGRIQSYFIGRTFRTDKHISNNGIFGRLNLHIGPLYGYADVAPNIMGWTLGIAPTFEIGYSKFSIETMVTPFADGGVVSFLFKYSWGKK